MRYYERNLATWEHNNKILGEVADIIQKGNSLIWEEDVAQLVRSHGKESLMKFKDSLCSFLSDRYQDIIERNNLAVTYGATQGLAMAVSLLAKPGTVTFVEEVAFADPVYMLEDHKCRVIPVKLCKDGIDTDEWEKLLAAHISEKKPPHIYNGLLYLIPDVHNPTAIIYSKERCKEILRLARKYNILVFCDDVYNTILYNNAVPKRMFGLDKKDDPDYGIGHVISNGTFSKVLTPALRFGWLEAPKWIVDLLEARFGNVAPHSQLLVRTLLDRGLFVPFLDKMIAFYKDRIETFCTRLNSGLPEGMRVPKPEGGFFVWFHATGIDMEELLQYCKEKYNLSFLVGHSFSFNGKYRDCARLCITTPDDDQLLTMADNLAAAVQHFISSSKRSSLGE